MIGKMEHDLPYRGDGRGIYKGEDLGEENNAVDRFLVGLFYLAGHCAADAYHLPAHIG